MYNDVKLEKGMYNLSGKNFTTALEELDPSAEYIGTDLESLDAFERQLKRFNIRVNGENCDCVEKFFHSTESAVLFPEYVKRCIAYQGWLLQGRYYDCDQAGGDFPCEPCFCIGCLCGIYWLPAE